MEVIGRFAEAIGLTGSNNASNQGLADIPEDNGYVWCNTTLPEEIILHILSYVPAKDLIKSAVIVCKYWNHLLSQHRFWFAKMEAEGTKILDSTRNKIEEIPDERLSLSILQSLCAKKYPFNTNLILNPSGAKEFKHWKIRPGGNGVRTECPPVGSDDIPEAAGLPTQHCFITSYNTSTRSQVIDLAKIGLEPRIIDALKPEIRITEWVSARFDCDSLSSFVVKLEGARGSEEVTEEWSSRMPEVEVGKWYKMERIVRDYPNNLKKIIFVNSGCDHQFWAGHYGAKTAGSSVMFLV